MTHSPTRGLLAAALMIAAIFTGSSVFAAKAANLSSDQTAAVQTISSYINKITEVRGQFTQISPKGNVSSGVFYISRPGKMRFEYSPPNPFVIISDGTWLTVQNKSKGQADQYPLSKTPLRLMLAKNVDLLREAIIKNVEQIDGLTTVTLEDRDQLVPGHLVLVYDNNRDALQQWAVIDGQGRRTTVSLDSMEFGQAADPKLFKVKKKEKKNRTLR